MIGRWRGLRLPDTTTPAQRAAAQKRFECQAEIDRLEALIRESQRMLAVHRTLLQSLPRPEKTS